MPFLQHTVDGLLTGTVYGLSGIGFAFVFLVLRRLDLSYGACLMAALYGIVWVAGRQELSFLSSLAVAIPLAAVALGYSQWLCFPNCMAAPPIAAVAASFAVWMQIEEAVTLLMPLHHYAFPVSVAARDLELGGLAIRPDLALAGLASIGAALGLHVFIYRTRTGRALRAAAQSRVMAALCGVSPTRLWVSTLLASALLGAIAAVTTGVVERAVTPMIGLSMTMKALLAVALGGLSTLHGPILGGLALGLFEAHAQAAFGPQGREFAIYLLLFLWLGTRSAVLPRHRWLPPPNWGGKSP